MLRCTLDRGALPMPVEELPIDDESGDRDRIFEWVGFPWKQTEAAKICLNRFRCKGCGVYVQTTHFAKTPDGSEPKINTDDVLFSEVLMKGLDFEEFCTALCKICGQDRHPCFICGERLTKEYYSPAAWHNRRERAAVCLECEAHRHAICESCGYAVDLPKARCSRCGKLKPRDGFSPGQWNHKKEKDRQILCLACEETKPGLRCDICGEVKPYSSFGAGSLDNKGKDGRRARCFDCAHPPCMFLPSCKTCAKCRRPGCKEPNCKKDIETLPSKQLPKTKEDVQNFACEHCEYVRCIVVQQDGTRCGRERTKKTRAKARARREHYECGQCLTWRDSCRNLSVATSR